MTAPNFRLPPFLPRQSEATAGAFSLDLARSCMGKCAQSYLPRQSAATAGAFSLQTDFCHCLAERGDQFDIFAFRGSASLRDWLTDFDIRRRAIGGGEEIHEGFDRAISSIAPQLVDYVHSSLSTLPSPLVITGHSLGGAMAQLAAQLLHKAGAPVLAIYTFGGPRVGNAAWAAGYDQCGLAARTWRVCDQVDLVPHVPVLGYEHAGHRVLLGLGSRILIDPPLWRTAAMDALCLYAGWRQRKLSILTDHPAAAYAARLEAAPAIESFTPQLTAEAAV